MEGVIRSANAPSKIKNNNYIQLFTVFALHNLILCTNKAIALSPIYSNYKWPNGPTRPNTARSSYKAH